MKTNWSAPPEDDKEETYDMDVAGIDSFHTDLIKLKTDVPETDIVTMITEDDVKYDQMILVLDAIKTLKETDPDLPQLPRKDGNERPTSARFLYNKVIMGSVIL